MQIPVFESVQPRLHNKSVQEKQIFSSCVSDTAEVFACEPGGQISGAFRILSVLPDSDGRRNFDPVWRVIDHPACLTGSLQVSTSVGLPFFVSILLWAAAEI